MKSCWTSKFVLEIPFDGFGNMQLYFWCQNKQLDQLLSSKEHEQEQREGKIAWGFFCYVSSKFSKEWEKALIQWN